MKRSGAYPCCTAVRLTDAARSMLHGSEYAPWMVNLTSGRRLSTHRAIGLAVARQAFEVLVCFCLGEERTFWEFEKRLLLLLFGLAVC